MNSLKVLETAPATLAATGLYTNMATSTIAPNVYEFEPQYPLWSDGEFKTRWIYVPECEAIDTSDMDYWDFPVGTRVWKEFVASGGVGGTRTTVETRLMARTGPGPDDWIFAAYQWNDAQTSAAITDGSEQVDVLGTQHNIPSTNQCRQCHGTLGASAGGTPSRINGFGALQLNYDAGLGLLDLQDLIDGGWLTSNPPAFDVPSASWGAAEPVLGNFFGNCGHCHNDTTEGLTYLDMDLRLGVDESDLMTSGPYDTTVCETLAFNPASYRIDGMNIGGSEIHARDSVRTGQQMPPLGTEAVDTAAIADLEAWIGTLAACPTL